MKNNIAQVQKDETFILRRAFSTILDLLVWYLSYIAILLVAFLMKYNVPKSKVNPMVYKEQFDTIIKTPLFIIIFIAFIALWEIVIPIVTHGQSFFKQKLNLKIVGDTQLGPANFIIRGVIKILILNPYGVIAYVISKAIRVNAANAISNILLLTVLVCAVLILMDKKPIHDMASKTSVISTK